MSTRSRDRRSSGRSPVLAVVLLFLLGACVPGEPLPPLGATRRDGDVVLLIRLCRTPVRLVELVESEDSLLTESDRRLWKITSAEGVRLAELVVGELPTGFEEVTPLSEDLSRARGLSLIVESSKGAEFVTDLEVQKLVEGRIWYFTKNVSREFFERETRC